MKTLARIEMDDDGKIVVASNLPPGPLVAAMGAALAQIANYIPAAPLDTIEAPQPPLVTLASVPLLEVQ